jgi:catechol 2,3-dioxygenase-like lactoylglutathione lyase family enzyme
VCLVTSKAALRSLEARLARRRIRITRRDDHNFGARGFGRSLYFDDPDGISIEVRCYA